MRAGLFTLLSTLVSSEHGRSNPAMRILCQVAVLFVLVSCHASRSMQPSLVEIDLLRGAQWAEECQGYDAQLPGYHLVGDIASIRLARQDASVPSKLVLSIQTSPGMPPNLEGFTVTTSTRVVHTAHGLELVEISDTVDHPPETVFEPQRTYFDFQIVEDAIQVIFLPKAMALLRDDCIVSWVDWYR